jgi:phosphoglycerate dehydrogenase-like enzyme
VRDAFPGIEILPIPQKGPLPDDVEGEVLVTQAWGSENLGEVVKRGVKWVHTIGTGVDRFPFAALGGIPLSCSRGASAVPIAEWVLAMLLAFEKQLPETWIQAPPERWNMADLGTLHGKTLALVGLGGIAEAIARRALPFEMRILGYRRTARPAPLPEIELVPELGELLAASDHIVVAAAATPATRHLIGRESLAKIRSGAHLVNIARGSLVDQEALREALDDGRVALASLDVCEPEPLPEGHWLYSHPRVRLSAHTSWSAPGAIERLVESFVENLGRYVNGQPLQWLVDVSQGY